LRPSNGSHYIIRGDESRSYKIEKEGR